jgi:DNA-directed RNA polymerase specialized sigma24 family protein
MQDSSSVSSPKLSAVLTLTLLSSDEPRQWKFAAGETIQIGRAAENDVLLDDRRVSRCHAAIIEPDGEWICISLGRAGTYFDGENLPEVTIHDGMVIEFGCDGVKLHCELTPNTEECEVDHERDNNSPVTVWIEQLAAGEEAAAGRLWDHYFQRVVRLARTRLSPHWRRVADEEDVAISVFSSLCAGISTGKYPELLGRDNLWRLLATRKAIDFVNHERRQKRGGGEVRGESVFLAAGGEEPFSGFDRLEGHEPAPEFALLMAEEAERLLDRLADQELQQIARFKLDGDSNEEIGQRLGCTGRTIQRRLQRIREIWSSETGTLSPPSTD